MTDESAWWIEVRTASGGRATCSISNRLDWKVASSLRRGGRRDRDRAAECVRFHGADHLDRRDHPRGRLLAVHVVEEWCGDDDRGRSAQDFDQVAEGIDHGGGDGAVSRSAWQPP